MSQNPSSFTPTPYEPSAPASFTPTQGNYKNLQPFRYWCQKVLPLVYDDSLSYYELLCKVVDYLNKTMEDVETLHDDVDNLHDSYVELQNDYNAKYAGMTEWVNQSYQDLVTFVNTYFANLDVQEEINNKLDAMTEDGTLTTLISAYVDPIYQAYETLINNQVSNQNNRITVLEGRMDTFASLPDGSTAGDAELEDIRVGANGVTYNTAGNAVRAQVSNIYNTLYPVTMHNGYMINDSGYRQIENGSAYCDYVEVNVGYKYHLYNIYVSGSRAVGLYNEKLQLVSIAITNSSATDIEITVPSGVKYIRGTAHINESIIFVSINDIDARFKKLENIVNDAVNTVETIDEKNKDISNGMYEYKLPSEFNFVSPIRIFTDDFVFRTDFNKEEHKVTGGNTYYIAPYGANTNEGTRVAPFNSFHTALSVIDDGDTVVFMSGNYSRDNGVDEITINKNINIIGEGKVRFFGGNFINFSEYGTGIYVGSRSYTTRVYEFDEETDTTLVYTRKTSIEAVEAEKGSYYIEGNNVYVNPLKSGTPNNGGSVILCSVDYATIIDCNTLNRSVKFYIENIEIIGSPKTCNLIQPANTLEACFDHVNFTYCGKSNLNAVNVKGGNVIFNKCIISQSFRDGFNYDGQYNNNLVTSNIVEIDCEAFGCGRETSDNTMNGSTAHRNAKVLRINGKYHDNYGANCADVQEDTESVNLGCKAYNSLSTDILANQNFAIQQHGTTMWFENCIGLGSDKDFTNSGGTMYLNNCAYETVVGTINETNHQPTFAALMRK